MLFRLLPIRYLCSPDTDVYNIGLSMPDNKDYIVQLNVHHSADKKYLILKHLILAFQGDPDLHALPRDHLGSIMQSLYISTGCDYISYFKTFGKAKIINIFTQYASFISGTDAGNLHQTDFINRGSGFVSFVRLISTCYFKSILQHLLLTVVILHLSICITLLTTVYLH